MTREERIEIVEHAAEAGAFEDAWQQGWRRTKDRKVEIRTLARVILRATMLVEEAPDDAVEATEWAWSAMAWSAIRHGKSVNTRPPFETSFEDKVAEALWAIAGGEAVFEAPDVEPEDRS